MPPRNLDDPNCKDKLFSGESEDSRNLDITPNILHKKHKVIKLVKAQLLDIQEQGLLDSNYSMNECNEYHSQYQDRTNQNAQMETTSTFCQWFVKLLLIIFLLLFIMAWLSAGPLSNRMPHTPIPWSSLVKTDGVCELERKYLLRWSTSNHLG